MGLGNEMAAGGMTLGTSILNNLIGEARANAQRRWVEKMTNEQREWDLNMWNKTNEYNSPANQVARLQEAGINPLNMGIDGQGAQPISAASPVGMPQTPTTGIENPYGAMAAAKMSDKQIELMNSQIDKNREETRGQSLNNDWAEKTMEARVKAPYLANNMTEEQIKTVEKEREKTLQEIKNLIQIEKNEIAKEALIQAQTWLEKAKASEIEYLKPYKALLMQAQTNAQKAAAAASFAKAALDEGLCTPEYFNAVINKAKNEAKSSEQIAAINEFAAACKNGTLYSYNGKAWNDVPAYLMNGLVHAFSTISQAIGGGLGGVISAAAK